ncbi:YciI family protein [Deminuibacter soli]|uniref:YCII-related domain-containing protein n=1 Tax=Deminuibacter soli TaxID=2291815 RepID=A0A3E1NJQ4_9BACT|nr:YciI family protein [Deminuibacter soli]RFM28054.1 hypothetical protein DXN05_10980 [Deminuibacter soli]
MPQFLILAEDFKDANALQRRLDIRPKHLDRMRVEKEKGTFIIGGAQLNEEGNMFGSMLIIELADEEAAQDWIQDDPYVTGQVWEHISITPFRVAAV